MLPPPAGLWAIKRLAGTLRSLDLGHVGPVSDVGMGHLALLSRLRSLRMLDAELVGAEGAAQLLRLSRLLSLHVDGLKGGPLLPGWLAGWWAALCCRMRLGCLLQLPLQRSAGLRLHPCRRLLLSTGLPLPQA
jgi:hypothetical protein